jgi:hypothetical protein
MSVGPAYSRTQVRVMLALSWRRKYAAFVAALD